MVKSEWEKKHESLSKKSVDYFHKLSTGLAEVAVEEEGHKAHVLPKGAHFEKRELQYFKELTTFQKCIEDGAFQLFSTLLKMAKLEPHLFDSQVAEELGHLVAFCSNLMGHQRDYFEALENNVCLQDMCNLSDKTVDALYQAAKKIYDERHYKDAAYAFGFLTLINPGCYAFWLGLGDSEYLSQHYQPALIAYSFAAQIKPSDPLCHIYSCRCYEQLKDVTCAINSLDLALFVIATSNQYVEWKANVEQEKWRLERLQK
jgi:hypothetical protein